MEPLYDLRFEGVNKPLQLVYNATVFQSTGENWDDVKLVLTEGLPKEKTTLPQFSRWFIDRTPPRKSTSNSTKTRSASDIIQTSGSGTLKGKLTDQETGEVLPFVNIVIEQYGQQITGSATDFDGKYSVRPIASGIYDVIVSYVGYNAKKVEGVRINGNKITFLDIQLESGIKLEEFQVVEYSVPLIDKDGGSSGGTVHREDITRMPGRSSTSLAASVGGVRGEYGYIDGIKVRGNIQPPFLYIDESPSISTPRISYHIPYSFTVPSNGEDRLLTIKSADVAVDYLYRSIPRVDTDVYLLARITDWGDLSLLSGKSTIYFEGAYSGESRLEAESIKDTLEIALGRDESIVIERKLNKELSTEQNLGSKTKREFQWEISARNNKSHPILLELIDQIPLAQNKSVNIELLNMEDAKFEKDEGKLTWEVKLNSNTSEKVKYGYALKYPKEARIYH